MNRKTPVILFAVALIGSVFALFLTLWLTTSARTLQPTAEPVQVTIDDSEQQMIGLTNSYRISHGLNLLSINLDLMTSSQVKADDMCEYGYWHHADSRGRPFSYFIDQTGYKYTTAGENLAMGFDSEPEAFTALLDSPEHLANIVGDYTDIGVGFSSCGGMNYTVMHYGRL